MFIVFLVRNFRIIELIIETVVMLDLLPQMQCLRSELVSHGHDGSTFRRDYLRFSRASSKSWMRWRQCSTVCRVNVLRFSSLNSPSRLPFTALAAASIFSKLAILPSLLGNCRKK